VRKRALETDFLSVKGGYGGEDVEEEKEEKNCTHVAG
jgi:hypothetical protein